MNKKLFFAILIFLFLIIVFFIIKMFEHFGVYEDVYTIDSMNFNSGDENNGYSAIVTDDTITFFDSDGNSIIYVFESDRLVNVFNVYNADSEEKAKKIAAYYYKQVGNGEIYDVNYKENIVSVQMDINYFSKYKEYSKKQIEDILLKTNDTIKE